jgi:hypothetical protein
MSFAGEVIHVLSIDEEEIEWGFVGKEKRMSISEIAAFYWDDADAFTFLILRKDGKQVRLPYMENVVSYKSRGALLAFLRSAFPSIQINGSIDIKTQQDAALQVEK